MADAEVALRKYPYPYKAALAISNDADLMTWSAFRDWHDFVNGESETPYGDGLGLEVTDSFWHWSHRGHLALFHNSPFEAPRPSPQHDQILELVRAGFLDVFHGFGEWAEPEGVSRNALLGALDYLADRSAVPRVYTNHGGMNMTHNLGGVWGYYQGGDDPDHHSYCLDVLDQAGVRYYWTDVMFENEKFGDDYALGDPKRLARLSAGHRQEQFFRIREMDRETALSTVTDALHCRDEAEARRLVYNKPMIRSRMRDGRDVWLFKRYRGEYPPHSGCFAHQVSSARLDALETNGGVAIVYQHFGVWRPLGVGKGEEANWGKRASVSPVLDVHGVWAFRRIAARHRRGSLLVAGTSRLLEYLWVRDHLEFNVRRQSGALVISLDGINCPIRGRQPVTPELAHGLGFTSPVNPERVVIRTSDGRDLSTRSTVSQDDPSVAVTCVPWERLSYPLA